MKIIRQVNNYSIVKKGNKFYIDNGIDDVSEYMDKLEVAPLLLHGDLEFIEFCKELFS